MDLAHKMNDPDEILAAIRGLNSLDNPIPDELLKMKIACCRRRTVVETVAVKASKSRAKPQLSIVRLQIIQSKTVGNARFQQISITR